MLTLGIETSCDETAAAVVEGGKVLSSEVSSSVHLHAAYGGVVPEIASRFHTEYILPVVKKALADAAKTIADIGLVAVSERPGLPGSLLVGEAFARALSFARGVPLVGVDHLHAHVYSAFMGNGLTGLVAAEEKFPFLGMVISGGHTSIYLCRGFTDLELIGRTLDDAAGEAFDKVAKLLALGYPGGPVIEKRAHDYGRRDVIAFPRALMSDSPGVDFSFSGIKTAVMYHWKDAEKTEEEKDRICYSFQEAVVDVIDRKVSEAVARTGAKRLAVGGGVIANAALRKRIGKRCSELGVELFLADDRFCSDNAAMVAALGWKLATHFQTGFGNFQTRFGNGSLP